MPARLEATRARNAEADADVADAAALSSYRPWVPGQQNTNVSLFFPCALESHSSYVRSTVCVSACPSGALHGLRSKSRHATGKGRAAISKFSASGRLPPSRRRRQPRLTATLDADSRVATALLVRFAHALLGLAVLFACLPLVGRHCTVTPNTAAYLIHVVPNRTTSPARSVPKNEQTEGGIGYIQLDISPLFTC